MMMDLRRNSNLCSPPPPPPSAPSSSHPSPSLPTLRRNRHSSPILGSSDILNGIGCADHHHLHHRHHHHHSVLVGTPKGSSSHCRLCGKRLLKLAMWRNYLILPCRCRHVFCKQCITGRLQCRQRVMTSATFDLMWTFPCPGSAQCGQELNVDWSRGRHYSRNLVARDLGSTEEAAMEIEQEEEEEEERETFFDGALISVADPNQNQTSGCMNHSADSAYLRKSMSFDL